MGLSGVVGRPRLGQASSHPAFRRPHVSIWHRAGRSVDLNSNIAFDYLRGIERYQVNALC